MAQRKDRGEDARARAAARRAEMRRAEARRRNGLIAAGAAGGAVVIALIVVIVVVLTHPSTAGKDVTAVASGAVTSAIAGVPSTTYDAVGTRGTGLTGGSTATSGVQTITPAGTPITTGGLPTFVYVGAEFCPYCAGERWAIATALARFGTFSGLQTTKSAGSPEPYPGTSTLTFVSARYTSRYLAFSSAETEDRAEKTLQTPTAAAQASFSKYDSQGGIPFVSIDNAYIGSIQYDVGLLKGLTADQIASDLRNPKSPVAEAILGSANVLSAGICQVTKEQPISVCGSAAVTGALPLLSGQLNAGTTSVG